MKNLESDAFVFFGATGDLASKQIYPALQAMTRHGHFDMPIIGVARSAESLDELRAHACENLEKHGGVDPRAFAALSAHLLPRHTAKLVCDRRGRAGQFGL
jgi:glucose-6-phosphate 1-dehydrogenase